MVFATDEPASGQCANAGTVWHGPHGAPPSGLTFRQPGHFAVTAASTWRVAWQASGGTLAGPTLGPLHGGIFSTELPVQVAEVPASTNG